MDNIQEQHTSMSRRDVLALIGVGLIAGPAIAQTGSPLPRCILTPEQIEGPFFIDERLQRTDLRIDPVDGTIKAGVPLLLLLRVSSVGSTGCSPLPGAIVDIWHCDAQGDYSDVSDTGTNTVGKTFLRGYQYSDANGEVRFITIYPGWYPGRAVHVHFKVRTPLPGGQLHEFTSQLYFDETVSDRALAHPAYGNRTTQRVRNENDGLFRRGGQQLTLVPLEGPQGFAASFDVGLQLA